MKLQNRRPTPRREPTRVLLTLARGTRARTTIVFVGRDLAFDPAEEVS